METENIDCVFEDFLREDGNGSGRSTGFEREGGAPVVTRRARQKTDRSVVLAALGDFELLRGVGAGAADTVNKPIFQCDAAGPPAFEIAAQRFGLARPFKGRAHALFDQAIEPGQYVGVGSLPVEIIFPGVIGEDQPHRSMSVCSDAAPASS